MSGVILFNIFFVLLFAMIVTMFVLFVKSVHRSLYYYRNVAYIAGIFFASTLMVSLYNYLIDCLLQTKQLTLRYMFIEFVNFPEKFSVFAIPLFAVICLLIIISNVSLIRHEGFRPKNLLGVVLGVLIIGGTFIIHHVGKIINERIIVNTGLGANPYIVAAFTYFNLFLILLMCYLECFFLGTVIMAYLAAKQKPTYDKDFIIILGCSIDKKGGLRPLLKGRTNRAVRYAWEQEIATGKPVRYIPSGGKGTDEIMSEGSAMELYLLSHGAEENEVFPEKQSTTTYENFLYSKKIIDEIDPDSRVCFATTNYHMFRSGVLALKAGINAQGVASKTKWYFWPNGFVREFMALLDMRKKDHLKVIGVLFTGCVILAVLAVIFGLRFK